MTAKRNWYDRVTSEFVQNVANMYIQEAPLDAFKIFPELNSNKLTGKIAKYNKEDWFYIGTVADYIRSGAAESAGDDYSTDSQSFTLLKYSFHKDVTEDESKEYDNPFAPSEDAVRFVINRINRVIMQHLVTSYFATSIWGTALVGTSDFVKWSNASATPVTDVLLWKEDIHKVAGFTPNRMIVTPDVHRYLKGCTAITNIMKTTDDKVVTNALIAKLFEVDDYVILDALNSAGTDYMATASVLLVHTPKRPSRMTPSAGYTVLYKGENLEVASTTRIEMPEKNHALRIEADVHCAPVVLAPDLGVFASNVL